MTITNAHDHLPVCRVVRRGWKDPIDTAFSQRHNVDNRWNTPDFPALYCCCSKTVARAIVKDRFGITGVDITDLQQPWYPQLLSLANYGDRSRPNVGQPILAAAGFQPASGLWAKVQRVTNIVTVSCEPQ